MAASRLTKGSSLSLRFSDAGFGPPPVLPAKYASAISTAIMRSASRAGSERDALSALAFSTSQRPAEAASALAYFDTLQRQHDESQRRVASLEATLEELAWWMISEATHAARAASSSFFTVVFGEGLVGMLLTPTPTGRVAVARLRADDGGMPMLARASGMISIGDHVIAINGKVLGRHGPPSVEDVEAELLAASRPMTVLFRRTLEARLHIEADDSENSSVA